MRVGKIGYMTVQEAAALCAVSARILRDWIKEDGAPLHHLPGGDALHWKDLHKSLLRRGRPMPPDLEAGPRVLLIDPDDQMLRLMVETLESLWDRARIAAAKDAQRGLIKLAELQPDLLITGIPWSATVNGELRRRALEDRSLRGMKILALGGRHSSSPDADAHLPKPFTPEDLFRTAVQLMGVRR